MIVLWATRGGSHLFDSVTSKGLEWILTLAAMLFAFALIQPADTFSISLTYRTMAWAVSAAGLTENAVGYSIMLAAAVRFAILGYNGLWTSSPIARRWLALAFVFLWFLVFVGVFQSVGMVSTANVYLALVAGEVVNIIRTSWETGQIPKLKRGQAVGRRDYSRH